MDSNAYTVFVQHPRLPTVSCANYRGFRVLVDRGSTKFLWEIYAIDDEQPRLGVGPWDQPLKSLFDHGEESSAEQARMAAIRRVDIELEAAPYAIYVSNDKETWQKWAVADDLGLFTLNSMVKVPPNDVVPWQYVKIVRDSKDKTG